jgi:hypothetical protein
LSQNRLPRVSCEETVTWSKGQGWMAEALPKTKSAIHGGLHRQTKRRVIFKMPSSGIFPPESTAVPRTHRQEHPSEGYGAIFPRLFLPSAPSRAPQSSRFILREMVRAVGSHTKPRSDPIGLGNGVTDILRGHLQFLLTGAGPACYTELRELLLQN